VFNQRVAIWFKKPTIEVLEKRAIGTCAEWLGIKFIEVGDDFLKATLQVDNRTKQPLGIVNGGANVTLAESVCSAAANFCVNPEEFRCVGLEINANHIRPAFEGSLITATCKPVHLGKKTQVWESRLEVHNKLSCLCRMTIAVIDKRSFEQNV
jgi:1,4-dihydroxy-2-naphthoyl-CoA hydrolase